MDLTKAVQIFVQIAERDKYQHGWDHEMDEAWHTILEAGRQKRNGYLKFATINDCLVVAHPAIIPHMIHRNASLQWTCTPVSSDGAMLAPIKASLGLEKYVD